ncbi:hypothetical protein BD770DRAFT_427292 [Pilaira anomala]|nr:hypothetical protein BD770DRAFT_427292 [Pilaira anomala]
MSTSIKTFFQKQTESSPLLDNLQQEESCKTMYKRIRHKYRFHISGAWLIVLLITGAITYFLNLENMKIVDPDVCTSDRDQRSAFVLSLLFGGAGADRFYLGYVLMGVIKLLTFGAAGIWWAVDIVLISMGVLHDINGCVL